jgi:hypothetical protein
MSSNCNGYESRMPTAIAFHFYSMTRRRSTDSLYSKRHPMRHMLLDHFAGNSFYGMHLRHTACDAHQQCAQCSWVGLIHTRVIDDIQPTFYKQSNRVTETLAKTHTASIIQEHGLQSVAYSNASMPLNHRRQCSTRRINTLPTPSGQASNRCHSATR